MHAQRLHTVTCQPRARMRMHVGGMLHVVRRTQRSISQRQRSLRPTRSKVAQATERAAAAGSNRGDGLHSGIGCAGAARVRRCLGRCREPLDRVGGDRAQQPAVEEHVHLRTCLPHSMTRARHKARRAVLHRARGMVRAARCAGGAARRGTRAAAAALARALTRHSTAALVGGVLIVYYLPKKQTEPSRT